MPTVHPVATCLPANRLTQAELRIAAEALIPDSPRKQGMLDLFDRGRIETRHLAMPVPWYLEPHGFADRMAVYQEVGLALCEYVAKAALEQADIDARDVDAIVFVSTTGIATPSLDARLCNLIPFRPDVKRIPVWGLGCAGGTAGLNRAADLAAARPDGHVLVIAMELCSLSFDVGKAMGMTTGGANGSRSQGATDNGEADKKTLVAASLFADGAAACIVSGDKAKAGPLRYVAGTSHLFPDSERVMGWDVADHNLDVVISPRIPEIVRAEMAGVVRPFLAAHGRTMVANWVLHPGGAKVLDAYAAALGLGERELRWASQVLRDNGNMSSPSVLFALKAAMDEGAMTNGGDALLAALGPGFAAELTLLEAR